MKLSLTLIRERLKNPEIIAFFKDSEAAFRLERPLFYTGQSTLKSDTLYIAGSEQLSGIRRFEKGSALICTGPVPKRIRENAPQILETIEGTDLFSLTNEIQQIFNLFDSWEKSLYEASSSGQMRGMYQKMLDVSSDIFENGLSIMDNAFRMIFQNDINIRDGGYTTPVSSEDNYSISTEVISLFKYDKDYQRISEERDVFYYDGEMLPHLVLCKNIFRDDQFLFRIIITECSRSFRKTDEILLDILSEFYQKSLYLDFPQNSLLSIGLASLLTETIESGTSNRPGIESELRKLAWAYNDTYRIASIHVSQDDILLSTLHYYSYEAAKLFPKACAFPFQDSIIVVINETRIGSLERYTEKLSFFVRENNFRIGISNFSDDISKIQILYRQAEVALTIGMSEKPMEWIHWFSRYTLQYIYNMLTSNSELGQLYSPIYYRLERYDKENATSYLETLRVYLDSGMNAVQAAKELFIQRSTMIYRLKRIREISENELEDRNDLLHLYLTFSIIEWEKSLTRPAFSDQ